MRIERLKWDWALLQMKFSIISVRTKNVGALNFSTCLREVYIEHCKVYDATTANEAHG